VLLIVPWPPPKIDGNVLVVCEAPPSPVLVDRAGQFFHTQQERFCPTLASTPVTTINPIRKTITPATRLRVRIDRRRAGPREANLENGSLKL
jgi:hypothetical protein